jgi:tyrosine-protein phosphatase SIW14
MPARCLSRLISRLVLPLIVLLAGCIATSADQFPKKPDTSAAEQPARRSTVIGVSNFGEVNSHLFRGGQPKGAGYANLKKMGVDVVVDLRLSGNDTEKKNVTKVGMEYVAIPWHCMFPKDRVSAKFLSVLEENKEKKVFVHCRYGDDRTGMMIAAYRMAVEGWTPEEARKEMEKFGFHKLVCPRLGPYEKNFPEHLMKSADFKEWRAQTASTTK